MVTVVNPCSEEVGLLRGLADRVRGGTSIGNCPRQSFQVSELSYAVDSIVEVVERGDPMRMEIVQREEYSMGTAAEMMLERMGDGYGKVVLDHPLQSPSKPRRPASKAPEQAIREAQVTDPKALVNAVAMASKASRSRGAGGAKQLY